MTLKTIQVLLVEDNPGDARLLREYLQLAPEGAYSVSGAHNLADGLDWLASAACDVVILDLTLPDSAGLDSYRRIHAQRPEVPVLVLTGLNDNALALAAVQEGAQDYLIKDEISEFALQRAMSYAIERNKLQTKLGESERRVSSLMRNLPGLAYCCKNDADWTTEYISDGCLELTGYTSEEILVKHLSSFKQFTRKEDFETVDRTIQSALARNEPYEIIYRIETREGQEKWVWEKGRGIPNSKGEIERLEGLITDITELKKSEAERELLLEQVQAGRLRLKELAQKVVLAQEEERRRISRELHDEAGQALTALRISLKLFYADLPDEYVEAKKKIGDTITLITTTMEQIRVLAQDLRPQALDALGLNSTLEGHCRNFARRTEVNIQYQGMETGPIPDITGISLYRFLQEGLTNSVKHANAANIQVSLRVEHGILTLKVQDDGVGFDPEVINQKKGQNGIGLLGMKERIELIGGKMEICSQPGQGAVLTAVVPVGESAMVERRQGDDTSCHRG